jgi:hypothetical protein
MATTGTLLEAMMNYYGNLSRQALGAMYQTREELRTGKFRVNKVIGRSLSFWMDAADGWWSAFLVSASAPLPTLFLDVQPDDTTTPDSVHVLVPGGVEPQLTVVGQIGGTFKIPKDFIDFEATSNRDAIEVRLKNVKGLRALKPPPPAGLYGGIIHVKEKPLAFLIIQISEPPGGGSSSGAA